MNTALNTLSYIEALQAGSSQAYRQLVRDYKDRVFAACYSYVRSQEDAEDLTQEVFLEVFRSVHRFRGEARLSTWIYRISVTKSLEFLRNSKRKKRSAPLASLAELQENGFDLPACRSQQPQACLEHKEQAQRLYGAIAALPENQQLAFSLNKLEGKSYQEVAEQMALSLPAVEGLLFRARQNLRKKLKGMETRMD